MLSRCNVVGLLAVVVVSCRFEVVPLLSDALPSTPGNVGAGAGAGVEAPQGGGQAPPGSETPQAGAAGTSALLPAPGASGVDAGVPAGDHDELPPDPPAALPNPPQDIPDAGNRNVELSDATTADVPPVGCAEAAPDVGQPYAVDCTGDAPCADAHYDARLCEWTATWTTTPTLPDCGPLPMVYWGAQLPPCTPPRDQCVRLQGAGWCTLAMMPDLVQPQLEPGWTLAESKPVAYTRDGVAVCPGDFRCP